MRVIAWRAAIALSWASDTLGGTSRITSLGTKRAPGGGRLNPLRAVVVVVFDVALLPALGAPAPPPGGGRLTGWIGGGSDGGGSGGSPRSGVGNSRDAMKTPSAAAATPPTTYQTVLLLLEFRMALVEAWRTEVCLCTAPTRSARRASTPAPMTGTCGKASGSSTDRPPRNAIFPGNARSAATHSTHCQNAMAKLCYPATADNAVNNCVLIAAVRSRRRCEPWRASPARGCSPW